MTKRFIQVLMHDATLWELPVEIVAHYVAKHYAMKKVQQDGPIYDATSYEETYHTYINKAKHLSDTTLLTWASRYLDWHDIARYAQQVGSKDIHNYHREWEGAVKMVVEHG